jgi:hypothetical protein
MKTPLLLLACVFVYSLPALANRYETPGTGVHYTLDSLVNNSGGVVTFSGGIYLVNDTVYVNKNDTLSINTDATVKYAANTYLKVRENAVLLINPPANVTFTAQDLTTGYLGMRLDTSNASVIRKLTFEYAVSMRISDCAPLLDSCILQYNNNLVSTSFGDGAISVFRASPVIRNCKFLYNKRAGIQGGANINNAPKIYNSLFEANNTTNTNRPQINLGATSTTGSDTCKIIGNTIIGGYTMSGGIGFSPIGNVYAIVSNNVIRRNRYGITYNGGSNIYSVTSYNIIDTNNIQNDPSLGGSGIAFTGAAGGTPQNSIVTGNIFRANLWGITIQQRSKPNLGNLSNSDTTDDGKNQFINNTNASTPGIDLYNNSIDNIDAENNYWNTDDPSVAETRIFHQVDNATLGLVDFSPLLTAAALPVKLVWFTAVIKDKKVALDWQTASEENTSHFDIQQSTNGTAFTTIGKVNAKGSSNVLTGYSYQHNTGGITATSLYYRLQVVDKDGKRSYSIVRKIGAPSSDGFSIVPNPAGRYISIAGDGVAQMRISRLNGQVIFNAKVSLPLTSFDTGVLPAGMYVVTITLQNGTVHSERMVVQ